MAAGITLHLNNKHSPFLSGRMYVVIILIMTVGLAMFPLSVLVDQGATTYNYCLVKSFIIITSVTLIFLVMIGVFCTAYKNDVEEVVSESVQKTVHEYHVTYILSTREHTVSRDHAFEMAARALDRLQSDYKCCGDIGPPDFGNSTCGFNNGPPSCHENNECDGELYKMGCRYPLMHIVEVNYIAIIALCAVASIIQSVAITLACSVLKYLQQGEGYQVI